MVSPMSLAEGTPKEGAKILKYLFFIFRKRKDFLAQVPSPELEITSHQYTGSANQPISNSLTPVASDNQPVNNSFTPVPRLLKVAKSKSA